MRFPSPSNRIRRKTVRHRATPSLCGGHASAFCTSLSWASTSLCSRFLKIRLLRLRYRRRGLFSLQVLAPRNVFTLVDPAFHADHAVRGLRLRCTEINIRAERLERQASLQVPFFAGDFRTVQAAGNTDFDSLAAETQSRVHRFAHRAAESNALFELQRNRFRNKRCLELRAVHFLNVDVHFALRAL